MHRISWWSMMSRTSVSWYAISSKTKLQRRHAEDAATARHALRDRRPDLILLDIWMPDLDGISLRTQGVVGRTGWCPVIMMSGHAR